MLFDRAVSDQPQNGLIFGENIRLSGKDSLSPFSSALCSPPLLIGGVAGSLLCFLTSFSASVFLSELLVAVLIFSLFFFLLFRWKKGLKFTLPLFLVLYGLFVFLYLDRLKEGFFLLYNKTVLSMQAKSIWTFFTFGVSPHAPEEYLSTLFLLFFAVLLLFLLSVVLFAFGSFWGYLLFTLPLPLLGFLFDLLPSLFSFMLLSSCYIAAAALRISLPMRSESGDNSNFKRSKINRHTRIFRGDRSERSFAGSLLALFCALLLFVPGLILFPRESFQPSEQTERFSNYLIYSIRHLFKEEPSHFPGDKTSAGIGGGILSEAGNLEVHGEVHLLVRSAKEIPMYLRGYAGSLYTGKRWEEPYSISQELIDFFSQPGFHPLNMSADYLDTLCLSSVSPEADILPFGVSIQNVAADPQYLYLPYQLASRKNSDAFSGSSFYRDAYVKTSILSPQREYHVSAYLCGSYPANDAVLSYETDGTGASFFERHAFGRLVYRFAQPPSYVENEQFYRRFVYQTYTQVPSSLRQRLQTLIEEEGWEEFSDEPERLIAAIRDYFSQTLTYTLTPGSTPEEKDFVEYFLFESRKGYCIHYASAMTLLLRTMGYPARFVEGYMVSAEDYTSPDENSFCAIRDTNAHAWTEVYRDGFGWVPYESVSSFASMAIPPQSDASIKEEEASSPESSSSEEPSSSSLSSSPSSHKEAEASSKSPEEAGPSEKGQGALLFFPILFLFSLFLLFAAILLIRRAITLFVRKKQFSSARPERSFPAVKNYLFRIFSFSGVPAESHLAPFEYAAQLEARYAEIAPGLCAELTELLARYEYSPALPSQSDCDRLLRLTEDFRGKVYASLSPTERLRFRFLSALS